MFLGFSLTELGVFKSYISMNRFAEFPTENYFLCLLSQIRVKYNFSLVGSLTYISQVIVKLLSSSVLAAMSRTTEKSDVLSANNFALVIKPSGRSLI